MSKTNWMIVALVSIATLLLGATTWRQIMVLRAPSGLTTANTKLLDVQNAAGSSVASIDLEGDVIATSVTSASCVVSGSALTAPGLTVGDAGVACNGGVTVAGPAAFNQGLTVDTNAFVVADTTGATTVAGLASLNGGIAVDTTAFTVADSTGNTVIGGTLKYGSAASVTDATLIESKGLMRWTSAATDVGQVTTKATVTQTFTATGVAPGDLALLITTASAVDAGVGNALEAGLVFRCFVQVADTISCEFSNNTGATIDPPSRTYTFAIWDLT